MTGETAIMPEDVQFLRNLAGVCQHYYSNPVTASELRNLATRIEQVLAFDSGALGEMPRSELWRWRHDH